MYIKTISNFLKDIEFLKCSFNECCVKYGRRLKTLDDYIDPGEQLNATTDYLEYLNSKKKLKLNRLTKTLKRLNVQSFGS